MRLIDADALKVSIDDNWNIDMMVSEIWGVIDHAPTIGSWISVKSRLPEEDDYRICREALDGAVFWFNGKEIGMGWYYASTGKWSDLNDHEVKGVTRWCHLPEPPEEVSGDD